MSDGPLGFGEDEAPRPPQDVGPPPAPPRPPERRRGGGAKLPGIVLVGATLILLALVGINTLRTQGASSTGPAAGRAMPPFAPLAASSVTGDVNVARRRGQGQAGSVPACAVRGPGILTSCDLVRDAPAALIFFLAGRSTCVGEVDRLAAAARSHPRVRLAAIALGGDRADVRRTAAERGWRFPVAWDRDAVLANLYGVAVCPQITFVEPGGIVRDTTVGALGTDGLERRLAGLEAASR